MSSKQSLSAEQIETQQLSAVASAAIRRPIIGFPSIEQQRSLMSSPLPKSVKSAKSAKSAKLNKKMSKRRSYRRRHA